MKRTIMRKIIPAFLATALLVFGVWFIFKDYSVKHPETDLQLTVDQLEELVYREPFNAEYQLDMARTQYDRWKKSMKTDPEAPSRSLSAYMLAYFESGEDVQVFQEFERIYKDILQYGSMPNIPLDIFYRNFILLYTDLVKPHMQMIITVRDLFESVWQTISSELEENKEIANARLAAINFIRMSFDLVTGKVRLYNADTKEQVILGNGFYKEWERGIRSYGQILPSNQDYNYHQLKELVDAPLDWSSLSQIKTGEYTGRYILPNGDELVPGLKYFEDIADNKYSPVTPELSTPSAVYSYFRQLQTQKRWSEMYDMIDVESQRRMTEETKIMLRMTVQDEESRRKLDSVLGPMNGRDLHALILQNSTQFPVEILSEEIDGDTAYLKIVTFKGGENVTSDVQLVRNGDSWKILWGSNLN